MSDVRCSSQTGFAKDMETVHKICSCKEFTISTIRLPQNGNSWDASLFSLFTLFTRAGYVKLYVTSTSYTTRKT